MHTAKATAETLEFLWRNYLVVCEQVDLDAMPPDTLAIHIKQNSPVRPFRISAWLARQGYFMSAWNLWERYSRSLCQSLPHQETKGRKASTVDWVARSLSTNSKSFSSHAWFASANCVRNLIAHAAGHVDGARGKELLQRSRTAFPKLETWQDGYLDLDHEDIADLHGKIEEFIHETG